MAKLLGHSAVVSSHSSALILAGLSLPDSMIQLWFLKWFVSINVGLHLALEDASFNACNVFLYVKMQSFLFSGNFLFQTLATFYGDSAEKRISYK